MASDTHRFIEELATQATPDCAALLQALVRIPSLSCREGEVTAHIREAFLRKGWDEAWIDGLGNVIGRIGQGPRVLAFDAHVDVVDVTDPSAFPYPPFDAVLADGYVWGRGAADQKGGMAAIVCLGQILRALHATTGVLDRVTVYGVGSVMEEDCDGLCWNWILERERLLPQAVVLTEPTRCRIHRGQRGRMEMEVRVGGRSAHGSMPHLGDNAIYKMARVVNEVETMGAGFRDDPFLGKGTVTVSAFRSESPSLCAVADGATIHLDRRLTTGETEEQAVAEILALPSVAAAGATVHVLEYDATSHTGQRFGMRKYYPSWALAEDHPLVAVARSCFAAQFGRPPEVGRWTFSTNGVTISGVHGIPCIGFGPADERDAHGPNDRCPVADLTTAMAFYAAFANTPSPPPCPKFG